MMDVTVSKTAEEELLIYKPDGEGGFINLIIDQEGDIEFMHITGNRERTTHEFDITIDKAIELWNR